MTNYDTLKEYEAHKEPLPSYDEYKHLQEQLKEANELLLDFCSKDECRFDHNGYCQEHDSCEGEYKCIQKDLKQYLEKWGVK